MSIKNTVTSALSLAESIEKLFLRFLVGKNKIYKEEEYNDGLQEKEADGDESLASSSESGWNQRVLLDVEKQRVEREVAAKHAKDKRNVRLTRHFQQLLLKVVNAQLKDSKKVIHSQLQYRQNTIELLSRLLASEPRYSVLASLLESNFAIRNRLLFLVGNEVFMATLGREPRNVRDIHSAMGLIGTDVLRFLVPAILFKSHIDAYSRHNPLFARKLWRYHMTLGQTCSALMQQRNYRRPYEGMLLSEMVNSAYVLSYQQYTASFEVVRTHCLDQAREKGEKDHHGFFFDLQTLILMFHKFKSKMEENPVFSNFFPNPKTIG